MREIHVLFVDDDDSIQKAIGEALALAGIKVTAVSSLREAREHLYMEKFDFAILDVVFSDGSGIDLKPCLDDANTPYTFMSQVSEHEAVKRFGQGLKGRLLPKGPGGLRMDLPTRIFDTVNRRMASL